MSDFKGTPGPWVFERSSGRVKSESLDCIVDTCSSSISPKDLDIDDANGQLIATAPELLEALQDALHAYDKHGEHSEWDSARAAIAKALGQ